MHLKLDLSSPPLTTYADPDVYIAAAELVDSETRFVHFSCNAIMFANENRLGWQNMNEMKRYVKLYSTFLVGDRPLFISDFVEVSGNNDNTLRNMRVYALLLCAEWCKRRKLPVEVSYRYRYD